MKTCLGSAVFACVIILAACAKPPSKPTIMVITSAAGDATLSRAGKHSPAAVGTVLAAGDVIQTKDGTVDVQLRGGSTLRVRQFTNMSVDRVLESDVRVGLNEGGVTAKVKKASTAQNFSVVSPTAIAGVRGTTFSMDVQEGEPPKVRVLDGKVAMVPRVPALEKYSQEQISKDDRLKKLADSLEQQEMILTDKTEGSIDPSAEKKLKEANAALDKGLTADEKPVELKAAVTSKPVTITPQEEAEKDTMVTVGEDLIEQAAKAGKEQAKDAGQQIAKEHEKGVNQAFDKIEARVTEKKLTSTQQIKEYYSVLEVITMKDTKQHSGAVVAQSGNILMLHAPDGVYRLNKQEIQYVDYFNVKK
ncbi:MAG: FecR domain-containing protein [Spirochaetia bacterium]|nr:FecR domain-containing protein [Spirochaetia bacterium]